MKLLHRRHREANEPAPPAPPAATAAPEAPSAADRAPGATEGPQTHGAIAVAAPPAGEPPADTAEPAAEASAETAAVPGAPAPVNAGIVLEGHEISKKVGRRRILRDVSLVARPRELVAIVGASGAGKTTLLKALAGVQEPTAGHVLFNGRDLYEHFDALRAGIGYVPQDDIIHRRLSVQRALGYAAQLRLPRGTSRHDRKVRVDEVIAELGLEEQRTTMVDRLSGGQRKRVSIGVELLTRPPIFFLDEPTAGLDPGTERRMMDLLRQLAEKGRTVVLVTHATHNIRRCDKVMFLAGGGRVAFFGTPDEALAYFGVEDFEEIYDQLETQRTPIEWERRYRRSPGFAATQPSEAETAAFEQQEKEPARDQIRSGKQFRILTRRYANTLINDRKLILLLLVQAPLLALALWALFKPDALAVPQGVTVIARNGNSVRIVQHDPTTHQLVNVQAGDELLAVEGSDCTQASAQQTLPQDCHPVSGDGNNDALRGAQLAFWLSAIAVWLGTLNAIREISREDAIYRRERLVNLKVVPYIASKLAVLTGLVVVQSTLLLAVAKARINIPVDKHILDLTVPWHIGGITSLHIPYPTGPLDGVWLTLVLAGAASVAVALVVSAAVSNPDRAIVAAPIIMVPQIMFAGGISPLSSLGPAEPLSYIVQMRWSYEAIGRVTHVVRQAAIPQTFPYTASLDGGALSRWLVLVGFIAAGSVLAVALQRLKGQR